MKNTAQNYWLIIGGAVVVTFGSLTALYFYSRKDKLSKPANRMDHKGLGSLSSGISSTSTIDPTSLNGAVITEPNWNKPFDMNYESDVAAWLKRPVKPLDTGLSQQWVKALHGAKKDFFALDDVAAVESVFKQIRTKVQLAQLSRAFFGQHKLDLWKYLTSFLSHSEMDRYVYRYTKSLENY